MMLVMVSAVVSTIVSMVITAIAVYIDLAALIVNHAENLTEHHLLNILLARVEIVAVIIAVIDRATITIVLVLATVPIVVSAIKLFKLQIRV